ncbi:MAG TPA: nucleoside deaminase [Pirellulaceae bacterium]|jgi:tRNA(Arg) A34 adenosine deaminase TadA|nr:nucleoside deaminase [Pirellulaceae bacterium]
MPDANAQFLDRAIELSLTDIEAPYARPFGAVVVFEGAIVAEAFNTAARSNDPTAHAEVNAIRAACVRFASHRLPENCQLYSSAEPCPMCFAASFWAGIAEIYFAVPSQEQSKYGFGDDELASLLGANRPRGTRLETANFDRAEEAFRRWVASHPDPQATA